MLTLLDRYIVKRLVDYLFLGLVLFTLVLFFSDALLDFMKDMQHYGISWDIAMTLVGLQLPKIVAVVIPMSALLATLMVYNTLNNHFELIALRMSGISLARLALPAILVGVVSALLTYVLYDYVVPTCTVYARSLKSFAIQEQNLPATQENFMYKQFDDSQQLKRLLYVARFENSKLGYTTLIDLTNPETLQVVQARSGAWGRGQIGLEDANVYTVSANQSVSNTTHATHLELENFIDPPTTVTEYKPKELSFPELRAWIAREQQKGEEIPRKVFLLLWEKITIPLSSIPLVMIAIPLAMSSPRKLSNMGFLSAIAILFGYYVIRHLSSQLGESGVLDPLIASLLPLVVITAIALGLFIRKNQVL